MAYNYGLLWLIYRLLYGIVACYLRLLGVPGRQYRVRYFGHFGGPGSVHNSNRLADASSCQCHESEGPMKDG